MSEWFHANKIDLQPRIKAVKDTKIKYFLLLQTFIGIVIILMINSNSDEQKDFGESNVAAKVWMLINIIS